MSFWYILLFIVFFLCTLARTKNFKKGQKIIFGLVLIILCVVAGMRINIGDTNAYLRYINNTPDSFKIFLSTFDFSGEWGFKVLLFITKKIFFGNCQLVLAFFSTTTILLILLIYKKLLKNFNLGIYLFITTTAYIMLMNGVRQFFVASIIFACISLITERKWAKFFIIVMLLSTIHKSVLLMIPCYFFFNIKPWSKQMYIFLLCIIVMYILYPIYGSVLSNYFMNDSEYSIYARELVNSEKGSSMIRVFVAAIPIIMSFFCKDVEEKENKYYRVIFNFSILNMSFYLLGVRHYIFARFIYYFIPASIVLLCWNIHYLKNKQIKFIIYFLCIVLYFIYYYYQVSVVWNIPYTPFFSSY